MGSVVSVGFAEETLLGLIFFVNCCNVLKSKVLVSVVSVVSVDVVDVVDVMDAVDAVDAVDGSFWVRWALVDVTKVDGLLQCILWLVRSFFWQTTEQYRTC